MRVKAVIVRTEHFGNWNDPKKEWYVKYRNDTHGPYKTYEEAEAKQKELEDV